MSYGYQQYGGNPYGSTGQSGGYGASNPYGSSGAYNQDVEAGYGSSNSYGLSAPYGGATEPISHQSSNYSRPQDQYNYGDAPPMPPQPAVMSNPDFLTRVEGVKSEIRQLTVNIGEIGSIHQRVLGSPDSASSSQLEAVVAQTQVLNTKIKDQIKQLEYDAAKDQGNKTKESQVRTLRTNFKNQLAEFQQEEQTYRQRYRDQIARQYRIVNPDASEQEVREAADANWGDEGVFQTALKSNRSAAATSVLGAVRARHNDIQQIERTLIELNKLFQDLAEAVIVQETAVQQTEDTTGRVIEDTQAGNTQLDKGIKSARNARKLKWWCLGIVVLIILILALVLGLYFGLNKATNSATN